MRRGMVLGSGIVVLLVATAAGPAPAPFDASLPMPELMGHVMQAAGDGIWKRQGSYVDASGEHSLFPTTDAGWEDAESASLLLAEVTNTLLVPGRRVPEPAWDSAVLRVRSVARAAAAAAEKHDEAAFFKAGGELDEACESCHLHYDPNARKLR